MWTVPEDHAHAPSPLARGAQGFACDLLLYYDRIGEESSREPLSSLKGDRKRGRLRVSRKYQIWTDNTVLREPTIRATVSYNKIGLTVLTAGIYPLMQQEVNDTHNEVQPGCCLLVNRECGISLPGRSFMVSRTIPRLPAPLLEDIPHYRALYHYRTSSLCPFFSYDLRAPHENRPGIL